MTWVCEWCRRNDPFIRSHPEQCQLLDCLKHKRAWHWHENPLSLVTAAHIGIDLTPAGIEVSKQMQATRLWLGPFG